MKYAMQENLLHIQTQGTYANKPLSDFLNDYSISKPVRYRYFQEGRFSINGKIVKNPSVTIHKNDVLSILLPQEQINWIPSQISSQVVYENDFVMIVHKPVGCIIHGDENDTDCLNARVAKFLKDRNTPTLIRPIHRLDKDTTGLVLYVKIPFFQPFFDEELQQRKISRHYYAITSGKAPLESGIFLIDDNIGKDRHNSNRFRVSPTGKTAITKVECLKTKNGYNLFGCTLETGRTHQIRVHLSSHNWPIVNDSLYGNPSKDFANMGLWANEISFHDPITRKKHKIKDFENPDFTYFSD